MWRHLPSSLHCLEHQQQPVLASLPWPATRPPLLLLWFLGVCLAWGATLSRSLTGWASWTTTILCWNWCIKLIYIGVCNVHLEPGAVITKLHFFRLSESLKCGNLVTVKLLVTMILSTNCWAKERVTNQSSRTCGCPDPGVWWYSRHLVIEAILNQTHLWNVRSFSLCTSLKHYLSSLTSCQVL